MALVARGSKLIDFLDIDIEDADEIINLIERRSSLLTALDQDAIIDFISDLNDEYCEENNLCKECRSPMEETFIEVPYGDTTVKESEGLTCGYCQY